MSSAYGAGESIDSFRKFFLKLLKTFLAHVCGVGVGKEKAEHEADPAEQQTAPGDKRNARQHQRRRDTKHEKISSADIQASLRQHFLQKRHPFRAPQKSVEGRNPA